MIKIKLILVLFLSAINTISSQESLDLEKIRKEITHSNEIKIQKDLILNYRSLGKLYDSPFKLSKITKQNNRDFTTSIYLWYSKDSIVDFPINDKYFDYDYLYKKVPEAREGSRPAVIISVDIYKSDSIPIILVNKIKLVEL